MTIRKPGAPQAKHVPDKQRSTSVKPGHEPTMLEHTNIPNNLYFSSTKNPSLADLRDALRKNQFSHMTYDASLDSKEFKNQFGLNKVTDISSGLHNPIEENKISALEIVIPAHVN